MQNLGERRSSINFLPRSSSQAIDSHKFFNKRLSFKSHHKWKTCKDLQRTFGIDFVINYYWIGLTNNQKHKLRYMDLEARLAIAWSDIEVLKQKVKEDDENYHDRIPMLLDYKKKYKEATEEGKDIEEMQLSSTTYENYSKELNVIYNEIYMKNSDYRKNVNNQLTELVDRIENIIYDFNDLIWISNSPVNELTTKFLLLRNKTVDIKNYFKLTKDLPSSNCNDEEKRRTMTRLATLVQRRFRGYQVRSKMTGLTDESFTDISKLDTQSKDNMQTIEGGNRYKKDDNEFLESYILNYHPDKNLEQIKYVGHHQYYLLDVPRTRDIYNIICELQTVKEFIKVSIDTNDQLPFKLLLLMFNMFILIGEYVWNTGVIQRELYDDDY